MFKTLIVDDESAAVKAMELIVSNYCPQLQVCGSAGTVADAVKMIRNEQPEIVFMDVELPGGTGFNILEETQDVNYEVIFISAHNHSVLRTFRYSSIDYLQKPVDIDELIGKIDKITNNRSSVNNTNVKYEVLFNNINTSHPENLAVFTKSGLVSVKSSDIVYITRENRTSVLFLLNGEQIESSTSINEFQFMLEENGFFRVNEDFLIQVNSIRKVYRFLNPRVKLVNGVVVSIDKGKLKLLNEVYLSK